MTAKDRDRVTKKGEGRVTTVSFGLKIDYLWLGLFQGLPTVIFLVAQSMQKWIKQLERPGIKLLAIINLANKYSSGYSQQVICSLQ